MATSPCQPIHPAVTHQLGFHIAAAEHTSRNYQVGFYKIRDSKDQVPAFQSFLASAGVVGTPEVIPDNVIRYGTVYQEPNSYTCSYRLADGLGYINVDKPDGFKEFRNLKNYDYFGNSSEGCIVIDYNSNNSEQFILTHPRVIAMNAIRAIDHINGTVAEARPYFTRVIPDPPPPLQIDTTQFNANESISVTPSFKLFIEYKGPDGQFTNFIASPINMWTTAFGKNEAKLNWDFEYKPYMSLSQVTSAYYGSPDFIKFFFDGISYSILEGEYKILNYPWRLESSGAVSYEWGTEEKTSIPVTVGSELGVIGEFSNFASEESFLHNHTYNIKFLRLISDHFEIKTIPPVIPKITNISHEIQTVVNQNPNTNDLLHPFVYTYILKIDYDKQYGVENTRTELTITDPPPAYAISRGHEEFAWTGAPWQDLPDPVTASFYIFPDAKTIEINLITNEAITKWGKYWEHNYSFTYQIKIHYKNIGQYTHEQIPNVGTATHTLDMLFSYFPDTMGEYISKGNGGESTWVGSMIEDLPEPIPSTFYSELIFENQITIKWFGFYQEGAHNKDVDVEVNVIAIDCSAIGGMDFNNRVIYAVNYLKANYPYPMGRYVAQ